MRFLYWWTIAACTCTLASALPSLLSVSSSRFWFNLRHSNNAAAVLHALAHHHLRQDGDTDKIVAFRPVWPLQTGDGLPRSQLAVAENFQCNIRHPAFHRPANFRNAGLFTGKGKEGVFSDCLPEAEGEEVGPQYLLQSVLGRYAAGTPSSKRLHSDGNGALVLFLTGHGGDGFLKFHDQQEVASNTLADAISASVASGRFKQVHLMLDTCQAASHAEAVAGPSRLSKAARLHELGVNVSSQRVSVTSSARKGENSYAYNTDAEVGQSIYDGFSYLFSEFVNQRTLTTTKPSNESSKQQQKSKSFADYCADNGISHGACARVKQNLEVSPPTKSTKSKNDAAIDVHTMGDAIRAIPHYQISSTAQSQIIADDSSADYSSLKLQDIMPHRRRVDHVDLIF